MSDGALYVGSGDGYLYALDAQTGQEKWKFAAGKVDTSSPAVADGVVYFGSYDDEGGALYAVDAKSGRQKWKFSEALANAHWGYSSPAVSDGVVYVGTSGEGGALYALDITSGQQKWKFSKVPVNANWTYSSPAVSDGVVYVGSDDLCLNAVDGETGRQKWQFKMEGMPSCPAVSGGFGMSGATTGIFTR